MTWRVEASDALDAWEPGKSEWRVQLLHDWLSDLTNRGPPGEAVSAPWDEDLLVTVVESVGVVVSLLAVAQDQYIRVKAIEDL